MFDAGPGHLPESAVSVLVRAQPRRRPACDAPPGAAGHGQRLKRGPGHVGIALGRPGHPEAAVRVVRPREPCDRVRTGALARRARSASTPKAV